MGEVGIPQRITGSAFGIACLIGYAPGMCLRHLRLAAGPFPRPQQGYTYVFSLMSLLALIGFMVASLLYRAVRKKHRPAA